MPTSEAYEATTVHRLNGTHKHRLASTNRHDAVVEATKIAENIRATYKDAPYNVHLTVTETTEIHRDDVA